MLHFHPARSRAWVNACMNTRTRNRTDHCQLRNSPTRPWVEHGPFLSADDELDELEADALDGDEDWPPDSLEDFLDRFD
jgi:hypothetical protein